MVGKWPCQNLHGGHGQMVNYTVDEMGHCNHPECDPANDDRAAPQKPVEESQASAQQAQTVNPTGNAENGTAV